MAHTISELNEIAEALAEYWTKEKADAADAALDRQNSKSKVEYLKKRKEAKKYEQVLRVQGKLVAFRN